MKRFSLAAAALSLSLAAGAAAAQPLEFNYDGLYKSLDTVANGDFAELRLAFYLYEQTPDASGKRRPCRIASGLITDGVNEAPLVSAANGELLLPHNDKLKQDKAKVRLELAGEQQCALSMQVELADTEMESFRLKDLHRWHGQMSRLFDTLAGWPGRYFMPDVVGVTLEFAEGTDGAVTLDGEGAQRYALDKGLVHITVDELDDLPENTRVLLPGQLVRLAPRLED